MAFMSRFRLLLLVGTGASVLLAGGLATVRGADGPQAVHDALSAAAADSIPSADLIQPSALGLLLVGPALRRPTILQVGFRVLYRSGHIPRSRYAGPASKPEGLAALREALRAVPRTAPVVLYCGCCPWRDCPNVLPAYRVAQAAGFTRVKVLSIANNLQKDWIDKGLPVTKPE